MTSPAHKEMAGCNAVVTGSSSGIGRAIALELAAAGSNVLVHAGHRENAAATVADEVRAHGVESHVVVQDIADASGQDRLFAEVRRCFAIADVWVNVAGADVLTGEAASWDFEQKLEALWRGEVVATARLSRMAGQWMRATRVGRSQPAALLTIGWDQVELGMEGDSGQLFAAVKGAVMAFTKSLALSLAPDVRVNCLAPGWIRTKWAEAASQKWQNRAQRESQLSRWGAPEEVAQTARFLVSPRASFINGQIVNVNGGFRPSGS
ncbi:MAG: SDR family oxidoreductase [Planctomycetales bacterium]|nr:SDR family oxidoreductase [Planctomycetales bacterium]